MVLLQDTSGLVLLCFTLSHVFLEFPLVKFLLRAKKTLKCFSGSMVLITVINPLQICYDWLGLFLLASLYTEIQVQRFAFHFFFLFPTKSDLVLLFTT